VCDPKAATGYGACDCALDGSPYLPVPPLEAGPGEGGKLEGGD
jgi:hypothetical protein